jgi:protein O-GlcNAc transferase
MSLPSLSEGLQLLQSGRIPEAQAILLQIATAQPRNAEAQHLLGMALFKSGDSAGAVDPILQAIQIDPKRPDFHFNLGAVLASLSRHDEAIECYKTALSLRPEYPQALSNLGNSLRAQGKFAQAADSIRHAIALRPDYAEAHNNLGSVLAAMRDYSAAVESFRTAASLRPTPPIFNNLATALFDWRRYDEAVAAAKSALKLQPNYLPAQRTLADALAARGDLEEAIEIYQRLLSQNPSNPGSLYNALAGALKNIARLDQAIAAYRKAVELDPTDSIAHSNLVFCLWYHKDYDPLTILKEHRQWDAQHARPLRASIRPHPNTRDPERRIKIGYVSPDLRSHAASFCTVPLLQNHDHSRFEICCYSTARETDAMTDRHKAYADLWRDCRDLTNEQLAEQVRADQIDILMDLSMHTAHNRLLAFARKPAPIQACWIACPGMTGLEAMDYRFTDPYIDPLGQTEQFYDEKSVRLATSFWAYDPLVDGPDIHPPPALRNGHITFGSLNKFCKVNDDVLDLWARVLKAVPNSRLLLHHSAHCAHEWVRKKLAVDPKRVELVRREVRMLYLEQFNQIDLCLDPFPYNGHMTTLDGLWMGVPVVSLVGRTPVGRAGLSLLPPLGLGELCANTEDDYVRIAVDWAGNLDRLTQIRAGLRARMKASPLMDGVKLARDIESIYIKIWRDWCAASNPPR